MARKRKQPDGKTEKFPLRLEWRSPAELAENPRNWRVHPENQQTALAGAMTEVGWAGACLFNEATGRLIDGHLRRKVAQMQGCELVPVLVGTWTEEQERKILATLDPLAGMAGADPVVLDELLQGVHTGCDDLRDMLTDLWDDVQADAIAGTETAEPQDAEPQVDRAEELRKKWKTAAGQLWHLGKHLLLCGDSTKTEDVARVMGGEKVDCVLTDPPYGIGWDCDYTRFTKKAVKTCSSQYDEIHGDEKPFDPAPWLAFDSAILWGANFYAGLLPIGSWLVWDKRSGDGTSFLADAELAWQKGGKGCYIKSINQQAEVSKLRDIAHPTKKPVALFVWCIERLGDGIVFDPYLGSGTTLIAAENLGRRCFGIEISPGYVAVCLQRYADAFPGRAIRRAD